MCYCTVFVLFYFVFEDISKYKPPGAYIWRGDFTEGFLCSEFEGLIFGIHGGAYFRNLTLHQTVSVRPFHELS